MTNELICSTTSGLALYVLLFDSAGQIYKAGALETPADANWTSYPIAMTEAGTTGIYRATMPAVAAGAYSYAVRAQAGASPATSDATVGTGSIRWTGTAEEGVPAQVDLVKWRGQTPLNLQSAGYVQAYLFDRSIDGLTGQAGLTSITFLDFLIQPSDLGANTITISQDYTILYHDNALVGWTVLIHDGNSSISYASPIISSNFATRTITMAEAMPAAEEWMEDPIHVLLLPFAISSLPSLRQAVGIANANLDSQLDTLASAVANLPTAVLSGGTVAWTYTLTNEIDSVPIPQARVEVYTDEAMVHLVAAGYTDNFGQVTFYLDPGTYYLKRIKAAWSFTNPDEEAIP